MTKIIDFKEKEKYSIPLMIKSCTKGTTQKGSPYLNLVLQDSSGSGKTERTPWRLSPCIPAPPPKATAQSLPLLLRR